MQLQILPTTGSYNTTLTGAPGEVDTGPMVFTMCPDMALSLVNYGFNTKPAFYDWVYDRTVIKHSEFKKFGWYDPTAIEASSGKPYNQLADNYDCHIMGTADQQLAIVSIYPGDEFLIIQSGGRGPSYCIDPWR